MQRQLDIANCGSDNISLKLHHSFSNGSVISDLCPENLYRRVHNIPVFVHTFERVFIHQTIVSFELYHNLLLKLSDLKL